VLLHLKFTIYKFWNYDGLNGVKYHGLAPLKILLISHL